jgi:5-methylcytosine-specific restriction endonuclease McrA
MGSATPPGRVGSAPVHGHRPRGRDAGRVLVLNATFEPINVCSVRRAAILLLKSKAELLEHATWELRSEHTAMPRPVVIRLVSYVRVPRDTHRRKITRRAVFARDGWTCQYCGSKANLTVDHVIPRSKGGTSDWDNIVASCAPCNRRKGDHLPEKAGMHPRRRPTAPSPHVFIHVASPTIPAAWRTWLPDLGPAYAEAA